MNPILTKTYISGAAVTGRRFVVQDSADNTVIQASANTSKIFGVSAPLGGEITLPVDVLQIGLAEITLGGVVTRGDLVTSDSVGRGVELSTAMLASASGRSGGMALQSGVSGDIIDILVCPQLVSAADGLTATTDEIDTLAGSVQDAEFTVGVEGTNAINVAIQLEDIAGDPIAARASVQAYLSADANGDSVITTAPDGNVVIGTDGLCMHLIENKLFQLTSEVDGDIDLTITESGAATYYLVVVLPNGKLKVSAAITFAG
ncbi:MAG: hypothetical protein WC898_02370 [Candidatus Paceibacterota bacterium]|jgi:hypothetical protein